jgi:anti-sigma regulatory factor (Ser/Thr protein kinase)
VARRLNYSPVIRAWLIDEVKEGRGFDLASRAAARFEITRQAVSRHIKRLTDERVLAPTGMTRSRSYQLAALSRFGRTYEIEGLEEHRVWATDVGPLLADVAPNVVGICEYGFTEILNNAIDHSGADSVLVTVDRTVAQIQMTVSDRGVGIFRKVREARGLETDREAVLEITKGKITTDPSRHTGEGIFFTSRMMDSFVVLSGSLGLVHKRASNDWLFEDPEEPKEGTIVSMKIDPTSDHSVSEVFEHYGAAREDYAFARTHISLALAQAAGGSLVSRSQAKRVMVGLDRFRLVLLDFRGVQSIGPAFADEIFRVWKRAHAEVAIMPVDASEEAKRMIARAEGADAPPGPPQ